MTPVVPLSNGSGSVAALYGLDTKIAMANRARWTVLEARRSVLWPAVIGLIRHSLLPRFACRAWRTRLPVCYYCALVRIHFARLLRRWLERDGFKKTIGRYANRDGHGV